MGRKQVQAKQEAAKTDSKGRGAQITETAIEAEPFGATRPGAGGGAATVKQGISSASERAAESEPVIKEAGESAGIPVFEGNITPEEQLALATEEGSRSPELTGRGTGPEREPRKSYVPWDQVSPHIQAGGGGGAGGGTEVTLEGTVGPQVPGELNAMLLGAQGASAQLAKIGLQARADALGIASDLHAEHAAGWEQDFEGTKKQINDILAEAEAEAEGIAELIDAAKTQQINPGQFFANAGGAGRFAAALAVGAGAMATAFGGGPNAAYGIIQAAIDRNVRAQVINMHHGRALIAHQTNFVNTIKGLAKDRAAYGNYLRLGLTALTETRLAELTAGLGETQAQLAAMDVKNIFTAKVAEARIKAITASQTKATIKLKSLAQAHMAQGFLQAGQLPPAAGGASRGGGGVAPAASGGTAGAAQPQLTRENFTGPIAVGSQKILAAVEDPLFHEMSPKDQLEAKGALSAGLTNIDRMKDLVELVENVSAPPSSAFWRTFRVSGDKRMFLAADDPAVAGMIAEYDRLHLAIQESQRAAENTRNAINTLPEMLRQAQRYGGEVTFMEALRDQISKNPELRKARLRPTIRILEQQANIISSRTGLRPVEMQPNE